MHSLLRRCPRVAVSSICQETRCLKERRNGERRNRKFTSSSHETINGSKRNRYFIGAGVAFCFSTYCWFRERKTRVLAASRPISEPGKPISHLPTYKSSDVALHSTKEKRIWVTFHEGVYDVTDFIDHHPGGDKIMMAAGGSVEPFWLMYGVHMKPEILALLEEYRIGNLDSKEALDATANMDDPYANEPRRHPALRPSALKPYNAEPPPSLLVDSFITPAELFYVRNHLPVPEVTAESYELEISGIGGQTVTLTLNDLMKFPKITVTATIQCAGNRRSEMTKIKEVKGLAWGHAAIANATWSGARLYDVLTSLGFKEDDERLKHVQFEGLDTDPANVPYGASIPIEKALNPRGDVILAYEMNGKPLTRDHGYPVRAIVPGVVGARNVKWLGRVVVTDEESDSHWQQRDYKGFSPSTDWDTVDFSKSPAIQELPVISAICEPEHRQIVHLIDGAINVKGYAWSGGGNRIVRVDVTSDCGKTWHVANIREQDSSKAPRHWGWTLWEVRLPIDKEKTLVEIWAKAVDSSYNTQPETFQHIWNLRGVLGNAYHKIQLRIAN